MDLLESAEKAADELRWLYWPAFKPEGEQEPVDLPVDPIAIARSLGLEVYVAAMAPDTSGMLIKRGAEYPEIYLNARDHRVRQRFTCGHEIGHYLRRDSQQESFEYVDRRDILATRGTDREEVHANRFAAALLMPADAVRQQHKEGWSPEYMARRFDVSLEAMLHRLKTLGLR